MLHQRQRSPEVGISPQLASQVPVHQRRLSKYEGSAGTTAIAGLRRNSLVQGPDSDHLLSGDARKRIGIGASGGLLGGGGTGGGGGGTGSSRKASSGGVIATLSTRLFRLARSRRVLYGFTLFFLLYYLSHKQGYDAQLLDRAPVPRALLPIIRQSGKLIQRISPAAGNRVKAWHDTRQARLHVGGNDGGDTAAASMEHVFHENGLLLVRGAERHPIAVLIEEAEKKWNAKVAKQSKTLREAVIEYKVRYRMNPPKGFDKWWEFVQRHNVQLPDEYDQIHRDLLPHRALESSDSRHRNAVMQEREHTFTVALEPDVVQPTLHGPHAGLKRAADVNLLLAMFASDLPRPVNLTFIVDDNPAVMLPYSQRDRMIELAEQGEYYGPSEFIAHDDPSLSNFARACPVDSPLRKSERGEPTENFSGTELRSFIWDHARAADICNHPEARRLHGHTMTSGVPLGPLVPLFTFAKTQSHADILVTPMEQWQPVYDLIYEPPWEQKSKSSLFWRGSTTGTQFNIDDAWRLSHRARLHLMKQEREGERSIIWSQRGAMHETTVPTAELNDLYLNTAFAGPTQQCDPETCTLLEETLDIKPTAGLAETHTYKYLIDVDGNGWSGRFHRLMSMESLVFKSTVFPEWYMDRVQPWYHYVPIKVDYSDIYDAMAYFVGTPDGRGGHDSVGQRLGLNGQTWARTYWRQADMASYMYRLTLEYSRILATEGPEDVDYIDASAFNMT